MELVPATAEILKNDGKTEMFKLLNTPDLETGKTGIELLSEGAKDADIPFSGGFIITMFHFHHPWTHRGYLTRASSADQVGGLYAAALNFWENGQRSNAWYQLGRALHLLQDIFIPQHSGVTALKGHRGLEKWLTVYCDLYKVSSGGYYHWKRKFMHPHHRSHHVSSEHPYDWIDHGSHISIHWYDRYFAGGGFDEDTFHRAASLFIPCMLRFSAGFIYKFYQDAEK